MAASLVRGAVPAITPESAAAWFLHRDLAPQAWGNDPHEVYASHVHDYDKVLLCVAGGITFHTADGDVPLRPGDVLDLDAGTPHAATVGADGVLCLESRR